MSANPKGKAFADLDKTWETLGSEDPLWAVYSEPGKEKRGWETDPFFASGDPTAQTIQERLESFGAERPSSSTPKNLLDFGCGVGRMSRAWANLGYHVTGVDISESMVGNAREFHKDDPRFEFRVNKEPDLGLFPDSSFDVVFSIICLQHIPWEIAQNYIREFGRVLRPNGFIAFQLPSRLKDTQAIRRAEWRRRFIDGLPLGLGTLYRRVKYGRSVNFHVYYTPEETVIETASTAPGIRFLDKDVDVSAGDPVESWFYFLTKSQ